MKRIRVVAALAIVLMVVMAAAALSAGGCKKKAVAPKELVISYSLPIQNLDPPLINRAPDYNFAINIFNGLVRYAPGATTVEPDIADRWEVSPDGLVYTFYLRQGVKFHGGYGEVTAKDVKFSFERVKDPALKSAFKPDFDYITSIEVVNDYTVKLTLNQPYSDFLPAVLAFRGGYILCQKAIEDLGEEWTIKPIGTGAYIVESYLANEEHVFVANPEYFRGKPAIDKVIFKTIPEETVQVMAMVNGSVDYAIIRSAEAFNLLKEKGLNYTATPVYGRFAATVNILRPGVDDKRVRQALAYAVNREEFLGTIMSGMGSLEGIWSVIPSGMYGYYADVQAYDYDVEKAEALLREAGHAGGAGLPALSVLSRPAYIPLSETLQGYWGRLGVDLKIDQQDGAALTSKWRAGDYDFYLLGPTRPSVDQMLLYIHSSHAPGCYTAYDAMIAAQRAEPDEQRRLQILQDLQVQVAEDCIHIPTHRELYVTAYRDGVTGDIPNTFFWLFLLELMDITN